MERVSENVNLTPDELIELLWIVLQDVAKTSITTSPRVAELIEKGNSPCVTDSDSSSVSESQSSSSPQPTDKPLETSSGSPGNPEPARELSQAEQAQAEEARRQAETDKATEATD